MNEYKTFDEVAEQLKEAGFRYEDKALWAGNQRLKPNDATAMLKPFGLTLHELGKLYRQQVAGVSWEDNKKIISVISPLFGRCHEWNQVDKDLFRYFKYAINPSDGSLLLLICDDNNRMHPLALGGLPRLELSRLSALCATIKVNGVPLKTIVDELFDSACTNATNLAAKSADPNQFAQWCIGNLPTTMLSHEQLNMMVEINQEETGKVTKPIDIFFGAMSDRVTPLRFVVEHADVLASNPDNMIPMPAIYTNDSNVPALNYLNLDELVNSQPCPTWDFYLTRYTDDEAKVFMAYIWSIFDANNTGRQLLYIYDKDGFSGKSVVIDAITSLLGTRLCVALQKDSLNNQFSMAKIWDKRLVTIDDNKNPNLIRSEKMHMLLGSGIAEIEQKGRNSFSSKLSCRVIACGNTMLTIDTQAVHESSRVIVIKPTLTDEIIQQIAAKDSSGNIVYDPSGRPKLIGDNAFGEKLKKEIKGFLYKCSAVYAELCPTGASIVVPDSILANNDEMGSECEDVYDSLMEHFNVGENYMCSPTEFIATVDSLLRNNIGSVVGCSISGFKEYLYKRYRVRKVTKRFGKDTRKMYVGIGIRANELKMVDVGDSFGWMGGDVGT